MPKGPAAYQQSLLPDLTAHFPSTRYQGSKVKLTDWIWKQVAELDFTTCLDAFGGTGCRLKGPVPESRRVFAVAYKARYGVIVLGNWQEEKPQWQP